MSAFLAAPQSGETCLPWDAVRGADIREGKKLKGKGMPEPIKIVALDYGERRIGVAVADTELRMALTHGTVEVATEAETLPAVVRVCREIGANRVVIGKPLNMDGSSGPAVRKAEAFAVALREALGIPVDMWDERLSTVAAERSLIDADMSRRRRKGVRDKLAAQIILQSYMDGMAQSGSADDPGE